MRYQAAVECASKYNFMNATAQNEIKRTFPFQLIAVTVFALVARVLAMIFFPLTDNTEARYGEIARKMVESNDWITLWYDYGVPFWAKPPLSTWLSAASMNAFGVSAFTARLPSLLISMLIIYWLMHVFSRSNAEPVRRASGVILMTMLMFYVAMGTVMTDMTLLLSCTLAMVGFWFAVDGNSHWWGYAFFAALGLGLLAKGPIALVLCGLPLFVWVCWTNNWKKMFSSLPILTGTLLMLLIGVPWYLLAEQKTPGFLEYFIVGEHFNRFMVTGWTGDRYGHVHEQMLGMIWPFLLMDSFPWSLALLGIWGSRAVKKQQVIQTPLDNQMKFLLCWLLLPNVFFTFARNIIPTYPLVSLPALAVITARELTPLAFKGNSFRKWFYASAACLPAAVIMALAVLAIRPDILPNTAARVGAAFHQVDYNAGDALVYVGDRIYTMEFYTAGKAHHFKSIEEAVTAADKLHAPYIALTYEQSTHIPSYLAPRLKLVATADPKYCIYKIGNAAQKG